MTIDVIETRPSDPKLTVTANMSSSPQLPVKRSLFGKVDHEECMEFLNKELNAINEEVARKWNFDFVNEQPLEAGSYEWTPVQSSEVIPKAYALNWPQPPSRSRSQQFHLDLEQNVSRKVTFTQKSIDGYMRSKKRLSPNSPEDKNMSSRLVKLRRTMKSPPSETAEKEKEVT